MNDIELVISKYGMKAVLTEIEKRCNVVYLACETVGDRDGSRAWKFARAHVETAIAHLPD
jgi:hypothetical protein